MLSCHVDGVPLLNGPLGRRAGAAFPLRSAPAKTVEWQRADGWRLIAAAQSRYLIAIGGDARGHDDAWQSAYAVAQEALDVWSVRGACVLETEDPYSNHMAFWDEPTGPVLRLAWRETLGISISMEVEVRDQHGHVKPEPPPVETWHESMRFFRQSQANVDLMDSLRSLWLAVENLLDDLEPFQRGIDNEERWLKRALKKALAMTSGTTGSVLTPSSAQGTAPAPHNAAFKYFYDDLRTHLFHAKASRKPTLPQTAGVVELTERHERLTRFYLDVLRARTGVVRPSGVLTFAGFDRATAFLDHDVRLFMSDDRTPFDAADHAAAPGGGQLVGADAARQTSLESAGRKVLAAVVQGGAADQLEQVRRLVLEHDGQAAAVHVLPGAVRAHGLERVELQVDFAMRNADQPKSFWAT
jgi:hypothetical protein